MKKMLRKPRRRISRPKDCYFCKNKLSVDYKDVETLKKFVSERGKISGRLISGICQKHQRALTQAIKQARFIALLPFIVRPS